MPDPVADAAAAAAATAAAAAAAAAKPAPWYGDKLTGEEIGYLQNRGLADKPVHEVAFAAIRAHREAEKFVGVPANEIVRVPKDAADAAGWKTVHERLGRPADKAGYDLANVKNAAGQAPDAALLDAVRETAFSLNLPKDAAPQLAAAILKLQEGAAATSLAEQTVKLAAERDALVKNWGVNKDANLLVAKAGATKLGMTPDDVAALEKVVGYARVMEMLRVVGAKTGEDKWITPAGGSDKVMSIDAAKERKSALMNDKDFVARYNKGDAAAHSEMLALNTLIVGGDDTADSRARSGR